MEINELMEKTKINLAMALSSAAASSVDSASFVCMGRTDDTKVKIIITAMKDNKQNLNVLAKVKRVDLDSEIQESYATSMLFLEKDGYTAEAILKRIEEELL